MIVFEKMNMMRNSKQGMRKVDEKMIKGKNKGVDIMMEHYKALNVVASIFFT